MNNNYVNERELYNSIFSLYDQGNTFCLRQVKYLNLKNFWNPINWKKLFTLPRAFVLKSVATNNNIAVVTAIPIDNKRKYSFFGLYYFDIRTHDNRYIWMPQTENWSGLPLGTLTNQTDNSISLKVVDLPINGMQQENIIYSSFFKFITPRNEYFFQEYRRIDMMWGGISMLNNDTYVIASDGTKILSTRLLTLDSNDIINIHSSCDDIDILLFVTMVYAYQAHRCTFELIRNF